LTRTPSLRSGPFSTRTGEKKFEIIDWREMARDVNMIKPRERSQPGFKFVEINWRAFDYHVSLKKLLLHLEVNPDAALDLKSAAAIASMESTHFSKFFAKKTGINFKRWNDLRRVERAKRSFAASDVSVTDVAFNLGFQDVGTFGRTFKRITGITPREFKRLVGPVA
jgi:AraC-like DNA-binding protein